MKIDPAAKPFTAMAAAPTLLAAVARRPRTTLALGLLTAGVTLFFRDPDRTPDRSPVTDLDVVLAPADGIVTMPDEPQPGIAPGTRRRVAAGQHLPVAARRAHQPLALRRPRRRRHPHARSVPRGLSRESATKNERSEIVVERVVAGRHPPGRLPPARRPARPAHRHPHRARRRGRHGRADRPDEVRFADGRLPPVPRSRSRSPRASAPSAARRCSAGSPPRALATAGREAMA